MPSLNPGPRIISNPLALPADEQFATEAARLVVTTNRDRQTAKKFAMMWCCILAHYEQTTPGAILDKLVKSQPSRNDQYGLMRRLRAKIEEAEH